jgi:L-2-hydroxyglutarate oxidase LhgO
MFDSKITIIGAGVIGLAIAEKLSADNEDVFVIEKYKTFGQETSSRNSEVIHAGIYYPKDSLKAKFCVEGKQMLYKFCKEYDVPFENCGKLIVATDDHEVTILEEIAIKAKNNGVNDIQKLTKEEALKIEPEVAVKGALFSPSTGIIDTHRLMKQLETNAVNNGTEFVYNAEVKGIKKIDQGYEIELSDADNQTFNFTTQNIINAAGLESDIIAKMAGIQNNNLELAFCKGEYFRIKSPKHKFLNRLVYPVPNPNLEGVGIHVTKDLGGGVKLGPDVTWMEKKIYDYKVDTSKQEAFYKSAKRFLPFLEYEDLVPEMAGIRPKLQRQGGETKDFYIREESDKGLPGFINLIGIESPGLSSSLAIAKYVSGWLK